MIASRMSGASATRGPGRVTCPMAASTASASASMRARVGRRASSPSRSSASARAWRSRPSATAPRAAISSASTPVSWRSCNRSSPGPASRQRRRRSSPSSATTLPKVSSSASVMRCAVRCETPKASQISSSPMPPRREAAIRARRIRSCALANDMRGPCLSVSGVGCHRELTQQQTTDRGTFVPLVFQPGEAFQFDWSEDWTHVGGERIKLQVAHDPRCRTAGRSWSGPVCCRR